ncbi:MAG: phenylalanine--tRNA ligase subunit beta [Chloroflexi bacterium]|nr:phenylalanine--tRNA ligase subunit beta [Chloroflexota bacterium]
MKISLKWLKEYVDIALPAEELAHKLTMAGFEVEGMRVIGGGWDNVVIGKILAINPHPNADRLTLPTIDLGTEQVTVVCGAPNLKVGVKVSYARVGAQLIDAHTGQVATLKAAKIRGIASNGMLCSERELGISDSHTGILTLPDDAPLGMPLADYMGDVILDVTITPNRPDCPSVIGIAREVAALTGQSLHIPEISYQEAGPSIEGQVGLAIRAPDLCPRYCASLVTGVKLAESPVWMQHRLQDCGMRPINNIVDITNYVMLEYGQPLHSFDFERIRGKKIIVRRANHGEVLITLDGVERKLSPDMLVIADEDRAVAVAGVMGGANTEVTGSTTTILLEAASFNPASIHYTGRTLGLPSEACTRFERGISAGMTMPALKRATQLLVELCGGVAARGIEEAYPGKTERAPLSLSAGDVNRILGSDFSLEQINNALTSLGFECKRIDSSLLVATPYWRSDIRLTVDLIEEVARVIGYDQIPMTMPVQPLNKPAPTPIIGLKRNVSQILTGLGFQEIITYSLTSLETMNNLSAAAQPAEPSLLRLANPMTSEQEYLRPSLRASLLAAVAANRRHEDSGIWLFELGKVYLPRNNNLPDERETLCAIMSGPAVEKSWHGEGRAPDFFEAKGVVESLLCRLGITASYEPASDESLNSAEQAAIVMDGARVGVLGKLHPDVLERFEITESAYLFEIDLPALLRFVVGDKLYRQIPRFPAVVRDVALVIDADVAHQRLVDIIKSFPLVEKVVLFDVYSGGQVPQGKKSLAYRITFQSREHTLTDSEVNTVQQQILERLGGELGAGLRG